ncbi:MAG: PASTA domain-containing protein [Lachnospiraceae bacterium]|nr:PASTA domain-containing protein [Lachnospiraceae bacterium]
MARKCMGCMNDYNEKYDVCPHCGFILGEVSDESYHLQPGTIINNKYIAGKVLGFGGFGVTYIGWDAVLEKKIAIKEYFPNEFCTRVHGQEKVSIYSGDKQEQFLAGKEKFISESKCLSKLMDVDGIVKVLDCFEANNTAYIVMEYLEGQTLKSVIEAQGKLDVDTAIEMIKPILQALDKVHEAGIIHRDIAPDNIFITNDGRIKIIDFGASRFATTKHSKSLAVMLKPGYSPEEQYRSGGDQGPWTDVYAVAATFYKMITGVTPEDAMDRGLNDKLKEPSKLGVKLGKNTENSIMNALNVKIEGRTQNAKAFLKDLEAEEVKRVKIKNIKMDIGRMPLWAKITCGVAVAAIATFLVLLATGVIHFDMKKMQANYLPEGYTRVPNVINMTNVDADTACKTNSIILQVYGKEYSDSVEADRILGQQLYGGSIVKNDTTLLVLASAGAAKIVVPDVVGYMESDATAILDDTDLVYVSKYIESSIKPGAVVTQSIEAETLVDAGTMLELDVSTGKSYDTSADTIVPEVVNVQFDDALDVAEDSALYIYKSGSEYSQTVPKGIIISQSPEAGKTVKQGDVINVVVSLGPETVMVPDVQYMAMNDAKAELETLGLTVKIEYVEDLVVVKDHVVSQSVEANTRVNKGSSITIYVSKGNVMANVDTEGITSDSFITQDEQDAYDDTQQTANVPSSTESANGGTTEAIQYEPVEQVTMVSVPNVLGMSESQAKSALVNSGLSAAVSYAHYEMETTGTVVGQNISSGTEVAMGSVINISVCNNETRTQYRSRSISEETTTSSSSALDGWTLYDTTKSWSDWGGWSEWSTASFTKNDATDVESKTQYRYKSKETKSSTSSSLDGWTQTGSEITSYTAWSGNKTTTSSISESNTVHIVSSSTVYNYYHYDNKYDWGDPGIDSVASGSGNGQKIVKNYAYHTYSTSKPLPKNNNFKDIGGKQMYGGVGSGAKACANNFYLWFLAGTTTTYTYQTRDPIYTYYYEKISDYTEWSDTDKSSSVAQPVNKETRTIYRYRTRSEITTYHYKRNVYGAWSEWSDTPVTESGTLDVETQEVYVY